MFSVVGREVRVSQEISVGAPQETNKEYDGK